MEPETRIYFACSNRADILVLSATSNLYSQITMVIVITLFHAERL